MVESQFPNNPVSSLSSFRSSFVGRQREMRELKAALDDARGGRGRLVMLVGEPGIGKTRTAQELASYAETLSAQVWWGRWPINHLGRIHLRRPGCSLLEHNSELVVCKTPSLLITIKLKILKELLERRYRSSQRHASKFLHTELKAPRQ